MCIGSKRQRAPSSCSDADPATNSQSAQLGDEARVYGQSVVFRQGQVLVRIVAYESGPGTAEALLALGRGVQGRL